MQQGAVAGPLVRQGGGRRVFGSVGLGAGATEVVRRE